MFKLRFGMVFIAVFLSVVDLVDAGQNHRKEYLGHAGDHAPIGIMGDHIHKQGEMMVSYRYMKMHMKDMLLGDKKKNLSDLPSNYSMYADEMQMDMHMLGLMWAPSDAYTVMVMANGLANDMDMTMRGMMGNTSMSDDSYGLSDVSVAVLMPFMKDQDHLDGVLSLGLSIPTGKTDIKRSTMMGQTTYAGYPMQIGSGSFDFLPKITVKKAYDRWFLGSQLSGGIPLGDNTSGYRVGASVLASAWASYALNPHLSSSLRVSYDSQASLQEKRSWSNATNNPLQAPFKGGYRMWRLALGLNTMMSEGVLAGYRMGVEYELPLSQYVVHYQMKESSRMTLGFQKTF